MTTASRVDALRSMATKRPDDARIRFALAVELLQGGELEDGIREMRIYLGMTDDEGNAWGRLATALEELGRTDEAREAWERGIEAAERHGHPTMAEEFREALDD